MTAPATAAHAANRSRSLLALGVMVASGFAGLGYQIVWTQQATLWLGHETAAVLAVVAAFFGGLALGAWALGQRIESSPRPWRWYVGCELVIAGWGVALALLIGPVSGGLLDLTGARPTPGWQWGVAFVGTFLLLVPATAAMGATLPAMEHITAKLHRQQRSIAGLYAGNTLGAVLGVLAAAFWLIPEFGLLRTAGLCVGLNLLCAAAALRLASDADPVAPPPPAVQRSGTLWILAATGLLGIGYEVLVARVLSQVAENTVYTFALLLAVYLVGTSVGAAAYQRWLRNPVRPVPLRNRLLAALAGACLLGTGALWGAELLKVEVQQQLGAGMGSALAAEAALALAAFGLPTIAMGALFGHLCRQARDDGASFGLALGVNTLGAAAAPLIFGVLLLPALGPKATLLIVAAGYLVLGLIASWRQPSLWAIAGAGLVLAIWAPPLAFVDVPPGGHIVSYREGATAAVSVVEDAQGVARLRIDNRQQEGSSASRWADARQALLPMLLHPAPRRALFLGLGTGVTASAAADDAQLQVDAVELLREVIEASAHFTGTADGQAPNPRLHLVAADSRRYVRASPQSYDLIVADNFHPARSGSGALYTVEHFQAVRERLGTSGLFCQWLPLHQMDLQTLRSIVQSFIAVYPGAWAMLATNSLETPVFGLIARRDDRRFDVAAVRQRLDDSRLPQSPAAFGIADEFALLGSFVAGPRSLAQFAGNAPINTDDLPVVAYRAPRITYAPDSLPRDRLLALLGELRLEPAALVGASTEPAWSRRLSAYWAARKLYIEAGRDVRPVADAERMLAQVRKPLLAVLRTSPDFRPAYDPLLRMAGLIAQTDPSAARELLQALERIQPARAEAGLAWRELSSEVEPKRR